MNDRRLFASGGIVALALAWAAAGTARAQVGQTAMDPGGGLVNRAVAATGILDGTQPGWLYYGVNAADRGLGYNGSYMTVGGFFPAIEDDLGGLWAADVRGHLSEYGGFFSNTGLVRKQFLGGTLLGVGVYWDYDGDMNQYPTGGAAGTGEFGQFGHTYNQVGISGEWLTDFGNLRSNGYIPVGATAYTLGAPGALFTQNYLLCQNGLDAALGGADLEVGAYLPGLSDWAGMVSVGGYALGNSGYLWSEGTQAGQAVVPWFGGVYTRLDMTFAQNWDFSLQANNDSYFDWTGFARLTYRMGGSRRRNVPDQVEQPMMRNEHIVRGHQTPVVAINPVNGAAWRVIHVDNAATVGGNGTAEAPVQTLAQAQALASNPYDVVFVHAGNSATTPYASTWAFQADNQILVGEGSTLQLNTLSCGYQQFFNTLPSSTYPVLTSSGNAITLRNGAIVDHLTVNSPAGAGILGSAGLTTGANVNDVRIVGTNAAGQAGVQLTNVPVGSSVNLLNMDVQNTRVGLDVNQGGADITFQGRIQTVASTGQSLVVLGATGGTINVNRTNATLATPVARNVATNQPQGIYDTNSLATAAIDISNNTNTTVNVGPASITTPSLTGVSLQGNNLPAGTSTIGFTGLAVTNSGSTSLISANNGAGTTVLVAGESRLSSTSPTAAVIDTNDNATLQLTLQSVTSAVPLATGTAINLQGASGGTVSVVETFTVGGGPGTAANVQNGTAGVTVNLP